MIARARRSASSRPRSRPSRRKVRLSVAQTRTLPARRGEASGKKKTTCGAPEIHRPWMPGATSTHSTFEVTNFFRNSGAPNSERSTGPRTSVETMPSRSYSVPCTAGRNGPPRTLRAPASSTGLPRPAASGSSCARGSVPTRSTVTPRRWKKRRMALRDCGTAKAATSATTAIATAATSARRRRGRSSSREATSGVGGHATVDPRDRRSRSSSVIALPQSLERAPRLEDAVLDGVLALVARDEVRDSVGDFLMHAHELCEGALVPTPGAAHELALLEWTALHRPHYTGRYAAVPRRRGACDVE